MVTLTRQHNGAAPSGPLHFTAVAQDGSRKGVTAVSFSNVSSDIFDRNISVRIESAEDERATIAAAKDGDEEATLRLYYAYSHGLRSAVSSAPSGVDPEDARQAALLGLLEAVKKFDLDDTRHDRLGPLVRVCSLDAIYATDPNAFTVPARTLNRFFSILAKADGNVYEAAALAPQHHMSREVFFSVLSAVRNVDGLEALQEGGDSDEGGSREVACAPLWDASDAEDDALLVAAAFDAVDEVEEEVCRLAYGFESYGDPVADVEIGHRLGMTRRVVQLRRSSALGKMREALAVS